MGAQEYNRDFAWRSGFPQGLSFSADSSREKIRPETEQFVSETRKFQQEEGLTADGYFGPSSFKRYKRAGYAHCDQFVMGYDVSYAQRADKLSHAKMLGLSPPHTFFWAKASEGTTIQDMRAQEHTEAALKTGQLFGYYHFFRFYVDKQNARAQATHFANCVRQLPPAKLRPVLDLEHKGYKVNADGSLRHGALEHGLWQKDRGEYKRLMTLEALKFVDQVERELRVRPLVYSYPSFLRSRVDVLDDPAWYRQHQLWLSSRRLTYPHDVPGWTMDDMVCQQFTSQGTETTRSVYDKGLDVNRAPWGMGPLLAYGNLAESF